jgi:predicted  nucleic acid-binding Zn-ribbon protein
MFKSCSDCSEGIERMIHLSGELKKGGAEILLIHTLSALVRLHELKHASAAEWSSRVDREMARCESEISPEIMKRYQIMEERYGKTALVPLKKGICTGCYLHQPKSGGIELSNQLYQCHYCGRLLYHLEDLYDESMF